MKSQFEEKIRESLKGYELPYDPKAWSAMRQKLDVVKPVSKVPIYLGVVSGVAAITAAVLLTVHFNQSTDQTKQESSQPSAIVETKKDNTGTEPFNGVSQNEKGNNPYHSERESVVPIDNNIEYNPNIGSTDPHNIDPNSDRVLTNNPSEIHEILEPSPNEFRFIDPVLENLICSGSTLSVNNKNEKPLVVISPNGNETTVKANSTGKLEGLKPGKYTYGYLSNNNLVVKGDFMVLESPKADFSAIRTDERYDDSGLPVTYVSSNELASSYFWNFEGVTADAREASAHFFKKGPHEIELTITATNGCENTVKKQVMIEESYNLMAMNSFVPTDIDPANTTFMPYSLKLRNTPFRMIIIDPRDGHVIYETTDASLGWDGIDRQTGQLVAYETAYIWKVVLDKPLKNESPEYAGTVVPLSNRR